VENKWEAESGAGVGLSEPLGVLVPVPLLVGWCQNVSLSCGMERAVGYVGRVTETPHGLDSSHENDAWVESLQTNVKSLLLS